VLGAHFIRPWWFEAPHCGIQSAGSRCSSVCFDSLQFSNQADYKRWQITNGGEVDHYILGRGGERTLWPGGQATPLALRGGGGNCCRCFGN
jgi:hypothetical protein